MSPSGTNQRRYSSAFEPRRRPTSLPAPSRIARIGSRGTVSPPIAVAYPGPPVIGVPPAVTTCSAAMSSAGVRAANPSRVVAIPSCFATSRVIRPALRTGTAVGAPLCRIARASRVLASGWATTEASRIEPADSPNAVTWSGSPPNAPTSAFTHCSAAITSLRPRFSGTPSSTEKPSAPSR